MPNSVSALINSSCVILSLLSSPPLDELLPPIAITLLLVLIHNVLVSSTHTNSLFGRYYFISCNSASSVTERIVKCATLYL